MLIVLLCNNRHCTVFNFIFNLFFFLFWFFCCSHNYNYQITYRHRLYIYAYVTAIYIYATWVLQRVDNIIIIISINATKLIFKNSRIKNFLYIHTYVFQLARVLFGFIRFHCFFLYFLVFCSFSHVFAIF